jgi:hypothetical protein
MVDDETGPAVPGGLGADPLHHLSGRRDDVVVGWGPTHPEDLLGDVKERLPPLLDVPPRTLVVDLGGMTRLSSGAVAALLWTGVACRSRGVPMRLRHVSRAGVATLRRAGLVAALEVDGPGS